MTAKETEMKKRINNNAQLPEGCPLSEHDLCNLIASNERKGDYTTGYGSIVPLIPAACTRKAFSQCMGAEFDLKQFWDNYLAGTYFPVDHASVFAFASAGDPLALKIMEWMTVNRYLSCNEARCQGELQETGIISKLVTRSLTEPEYKKWYLHFINSARKLVEADRHTYRSVTTPPVHIEVYYEKGYRLRRINEEEVGKLAYESEIIELSCERGIRTPLLEALADELIRTVQKNLPYFEKEDPARLYMGPVQAFADILRGYIHKRKYPAHLYVVECTDAYLKQAVANANPNNDFKNDNRNEREVLGMLLEGKYRQGYKDKERDIEACLGDGI